MHTDEGKIRRHFCCNEKPKGAFSTSMQMPQSMCLNIRSRSVKHKYKERMRVKEIDQANLSQWLAIAEMAARQAGNYLLKKLGTAKVTAHKSLLDDLLDADLEAERLILTRLREGLPEM